MNIRHMKLSDKYDSGKWPQRITVEQGGSKRHYHPTGNYPGNVANDEVLKLNPPEPWPDVVELINHGQLKIYEREDAPHTPDAPKRSKHNAQGMLHELNRLKLENEQLRALYRQHLENERLHELCDRLIEYVSDDRCEGCACKTSCRNDELDKCWQLTDIRELAAELGKVVD